MKINEFIDSYKPEMSEYCPVVICSDGDIVESREGHLETLIKISGENDILGKVPADVSPLLYLAGKLGCVIVDYENQIYMGELTKEQEYALSALSDKGLIERHSSKMNSEALHL